MRALLILFAASALAYGGTVCVDGTLATYEALGASGCSIGTNTVFSFANVSGTTGATEFDPTLVSITPVGGSSNPELDFTVSATASNGQLLETIFTYQISGNTFTGNDIVLSGSSESGNGAVTDIQNICEGGTFGPDGVDGCTGSADSLLALDGIQNMDSRTFSALSIAVTDDFTLDSGGDGSASGGMFDDQFMSTATTSTPEPGTFLLAGAMLVALGGLKFSRKFSN